MPHSIHNLKPKAGSRTKKFRVGRGLGTGRGKTAGRGTKGQRSRTGGRKRLALKGMRKMLLGFPKYSGFTSRWSKAVAIDVSKLDIFAADTQVDLAALKAKNLASRADRSAKLVGSGELKNKLIIKGLPASAAAKAAIEKAGGKFIK